MREVLYRLYSMFLDTGVPKRLAVEDGSKNLDAKRRAEVRMVGSAATDDPAHVEYVEVVTRRDLARDPAAIALESLPLAERSHEHIASLDRSEDAIGSFDLVINLLVFERADGEAVAFFGDDVGREPERGRKLTRRGARCDGSGRV